MDLDANSPRARKGSGFRVTPSAHGMHRVELWDVMPVGWLGSFTRATSRISVDIVRGVARRGEHARWSAEFDVQDAVGGDIAHIDFLALARESARDWPVPELELLSFELERSGDERRALLLTVRARDKMGFLASLLEHLAGFVLFPEEIHIDTFQNEAHDSLSLSSVGGQKPGPDIEAALRASLVACTRQRVPFSEHVNVGEGRTPAKIAGKTVESTERLGSSARFRRRSSQLREKLFRLGTRCFGRHARSGFVSQRRCVRRLRVPRQLRTRARH